MALVINLGSQTSISIAGGDILQLPEVETLGNTNVSINVVGSAVLRPASGEKVNNVSGDTALTEGKYLLFTTGAQNANWSLLSTSADGGVTSIVAGTNITIDPVGGTGDVTINASGGVTNPLEENLDAGTYDITNIQNLEASDITSNHLYLGTSGEQGSLNMYLDGDDTEFYQFQADETPASSVTISINDPDNTSVQLGLVDSAGGSNGQVPVWNTGPGSGGYFSLQDPSGGSGNVYLGPDVVTDVDDDYQILNDDSYIVYIGTGGHTISLPDSPVLGQMHTIAHSGSGNITISTGEATFSMPQWAGLMTFIYIPNGFGYNWVNLGPYYPNDYYYPTTNTVGLGTTSSTGHIRLNGPSVSSVYDMNIADPGGNVGLYGSDSFSTDGTIPFTFVNSGNKYTTNESFGAGAKRMGVATVASGTVTVSTTAVTANSLIFLTARNASGVSVAEDYANRNSGSDFTIKASADVDVMWMVVEP